MLIYAGLDEAGYGPLLGPLCVAMCVMEVDADPADGAPDLWARLEAVVTRDRRDAQGRIAVDDSKRLKGANSSKAHPLRHLERGVLAFLLAAEDGAATPGDDADLVARLGGAIPAHPWYAGPVALPAAIDPGRLRIDAARLRRELAAAGVRMRALRVDVVDPERLNAGIERSGSKASVNLDAALGHADALRRACPGDHPRLVADRHGGRVRYRESIGRRWPGDAVETLAEHPDLSRYRLEGPGGRLTVSFEKEADARHLPVALASMAAKYVRELMMTRLNRWFAGEAPGLRPTAGYVTDGRRFLEEAAPVIEARGLDRRALVRRA